MLFGLVSSGATLERAPHIVTPPIRHSLVVVYVVKAAQFVTSKIEFK